MLQWRGLGWLWPALASYQSWCHISGPGSQPVFTSLWPESWWNWAKVQNCRSTKVQEYKKHRTAVKRVWRKDGLVWSGLVWSGLVWSGLVWSGLVWSGLVWSGLVWSGLVWSIFLVICTLLTQAENTFWKEFMSESSQKVQNCQFLKFLEWETVYIWTFKNLIEPLNQQCSDIMWQSAPLLDHSTAIEHICGATCISSANYFFKSW